MNTNKALIIDRGVRKISFFSTATPMILTKCLALLYALLLCGVGSELTYDMAMRSLEWTSSDGEMKIRQCGPLNLLIGFLVNKTGMVYNKRWFSPQICPKYRVEKSQSGEVVYRRVPEDDEACDDFHRVLLNIFPSGSGTHLSILRTNDRSTSIKFVAELMAMSLGAGDMKWNKTQWPSICHKYLSGIYPIP